MKKIFACITALLLMGSAVFLLGSAGCVKEGVTVSGVAVGGMPYPAAAAAVREKLSSARVPFTLHQDAPVCEPDPLDAAACAVLRTTKAGVRLKEAIAPSDALRAVTKNAAAQYGLSDRGDIAEGLRADFLILEGDPLRDIASARVKETFLRGRCVFFRP